MQLSVGLPSFSSDPHAIPPERFRRYARTAERYGFSGAWVIEHLVRPPTYTTSFLDPLTTLALVAGATETMPVGTSVLLLPLRNPVLVAKRAVTIQHLSSRRVTLGIGTGYVQEEFDAVGVPRGERSARFREGIELLRRLLHEETVTFTGEYYSIEDFRLEPNLGQPPRILTGGGGVTVDGERHVPDSVSARFDYADGWIAPPRSHETLSADWQAFASHLESTGRDPDSVSRVGLQYIHLVPGTDPDRIRKAQVQRYNQLRGDASPPDYVAENWLTGSVDDVIDTLSVYAERGFDEVVLHPTVTDPGELDRQLRLWRDYFCPEFP